MNNEDELDKLLLINEKNKSISFVSSSILIEAVYFQKEKVLSVVFRATPEYKYSFFDVPAQTANELFDTANKDESSGSYFHKNIKKKFTFSKYKNKNYNKE